MENWLAFAAVLWLFALQVSVASHMTENYELQQDRRHNVTVCAIIWQR